MTSIKGSVVVIIIAVIIMLFFGVIFSRDAMLARYAVVVYLSVRLPFCLMGVVGIA